MGGRHQLLLRVRIGLDCAHAPSCDQREGLHSGRDRGSLRGPGLVRERHGAAREGLSDFARAAHDLRTGDGRMWFRNVYKCEQPKVQTASLCAAREKATLCPTPTIAPIPSPAV